MRWSDGGCVLFVIATGSRPRVVNEEIQDAMFNGLGVGAITGAVGGLLGGLPSLFG